MAGQHGAGSSSTGGIGTNRQSKMPKYTKFTQQELPAYKVILTPRWMITILLAVGFVLIPIGVVTLLASRGVVEIVEQYDTVCPRGLTTKQERMESIQDPISVKNCSLQITVPKRMQAPVFVYYQLDNFYQNHRRYIKSRSDAQLRGKDVNNVGGCGPEDYYNGQPITPCGLIAWSLFNDTYLFKIGSEVLTVVERDISWKIDRNAKFGSNVFPRNFPNNERSNASGSNGSGPNGSGGARLDVSVPLHLQEHLIVWMRPAPLPSFRKLWGKIDRDLEQGTILDVTVHHVYNVYIFDGHKKLVLSTASWLGGKNTFFGNVFLSVGLMSVLLGAVLFLIHLRYPRPLGDMSRASWNRSNSLDSSSTHQTN